VSALPGRPLTAARDRTPGMAKALVIFLAFLVTIVSGCGSAGNDARQYVEAGLGELPTEAETTEMVDSIAFLATYAGTASPDYEQELEKVRKQVDGFKKKGRKARLEYDKVLEAEAGKDFEQLARIEIENIDVTVEWLDSAMGFVEGLAVAVKESGGTLDEKTEAEMKSAFERSNQLLDRKSELRVEADALMKDMGINI